uniref:Protein kinase domain-containing protein n=1 Tax=Oryza brachyantha TaxID=4533 RepID=J3N0Z1_ORYBR
MGRRLPATAAHLRRGLSSKLHVSTDHDQQQQAIRLTVGLLPGAVATHGPDIARVSEEPRWVHWRQSHRRVRQVHAQQRADEEGSLEALKCSACGCRNNFHHKDVDDFDGDSCAAHAHGHSHGYGDALRGSVPAAAAIPGVLWRQGPRRVRQVHAQQRADEEGSLEALKCSACGCRNNFHHKDVDDFDGDSCAAHAHGHSHGYGDALRGSVPAAAGISPGPPCRCTTTRMTAAKLPSSLPPTRRPHENSSRLGALGRGACAVVYEARDRCTGETVAVKCFCTPGGGGGPQEDALAFARERHCLEVCRGHPSVVQLRDVAVDPTCSWDRYLVMEFVGRCTLRDLIFCGRPFSNAETRALMRQLLAGARAIHGAGLIHRHIKPANVLVGPGCTLKFCDFGDATPAIPPHEEFLVGTLRYTSPEQLVGDRY